MGAHVVPEEFKNDKAAYVSLVKGSPKPQNPKFKKKNKYNNFEFKIVFIIIIYNFKN
jgi:hypothetical protein